MNQAEEEKQCRICYDGPNDESGRLISPCRCTGSIRVRIPSTYTQTVDYTEVLVSIFMSNVCSNGEKCLEPKTHSTNVHSVTTNIGSPEPQRLGLHLITVGCSTTQGSSRTISLTFTQQYLLFH